MDIIPWFSILWCGFSINSCFAICGVLEVWRGLCTEGKKRPGIRAPVSWRELVPIVVMRKAPPPPVAKENGFAIIPVKFKTELMKATMGLIYLRDILLRSVFPGSNPPR